MAQSMSKQELMALPVSVDLVTAARAIGIGRTLAYQLAKTGHLIDGVPIIEVGGKFRVNRAHLLRALGVEDAA